jgi:hypothetical protein
MRRGPHDDVSLPTVPCGRDAPRSVRAPQAQGAAAGGSVGRKYVIRLVVHRHNAALVSDVCSRAAFFGRVGVRRCFFSLSGQPSRSAAARFFISGAVRSGGGSPSPVSYAIGIAVSAAA